MKALLTQWPSVLRNKKWPQFIWLAVISSLLILPFSANAAPSDELAQLLNSVRSMKANFTQLTYNNKGKVTQRAYGRMAMQRPGRFRWDVTKPIPQLIIANQTKLWIYDPDLQQVTVRSLQKAAGETPALLLSHDNSMLGTHFNVKTLPNDAKQRHWFVLSPKKADDMFVSIRMGFSGNQILEMRLQDNLGHTTIIQFQNIQQNVNVPASLFVFKPSKKIDVIDETHKK
jgi:outer membrane lipoprotein carrier protein